MNVDTAERSPQSEDPAHSELSQAGGDAGHEQGAGFGSAAIVILWKDPPVEDR